MKFSRSLAGLAVATAVAAQPSFPSSIAGLTFSQQCQTSIISVVSNGSFAECFQFADLAPLLTGNGSIVPVLDNFMSDLCYSPKTCSNATLQQAAQTIISGCGGDLKNESIPDSVVTTAFNLYPLVREVLCLKTSDPYTNESYGGSLGSPPVPITAYNSTGGYFCVSSLLTQLSAYFGTNLTVPFITSAVTNVNTTAVNLAKEINPNILCNECIFGALDLVAESYPKLANVSVAPVLGYLNMSISGAENVTVGQFVDNECSYIPLAITTNGTLPENITETAVNSTFPLPVMNGTSSNGTSGGMATPGVVPGATTAPSGPSMASGMMPSGSMTPPSMSMPSGSVSGAATSAASAASGASSGAASVVGGATSAAGSAAGAATSAAGSAAGAASSAASSAA